jgi:hypothetical protein
MISKGGYITFTDPGGGDYTRQYFSEERYTILEPSARGHSLPIINGITETVKAENAPHSNKSVIKRDTSFFIPSPPADRPLAADIDLPLLYHLLFSFSICKIPQNKREDLLQ